MLSAPKVTDERMNIDCYSSLPMAQQPLVVQGLLIVEASRSHSDTPHSVGLLWTGDHPKQIPLPDNTQHLPLRDSNPQSPQASGRRPTRGHLNRPSNGTYGGKSKLAGKKSVSVSLCWTQIPRVLAWHCTRAFTVRGRQLGARAMRSFQVTTERTCL